MCDVFGDPEVCRWAGDNCWYFASVMGSAESYNSNNYNFRTPCVGELCAGAGVDRLTAFIDANKARWGTPANVSFYACNGLVMRAMSSDLGECLGGGAAGREGATAALIACNACEGAARRHSALLEPARTLPRTPCRPGRSYDRLLPPLLGAGVRVMVLVGELDFICNWEGNQRMLDRLMWSGEGAWAGAKPRNWTFGGASQGRVRQARGLTFATVAKSGHMVPRDQPALSLFLIRKWIAGQPI